MLLQSVVSMLLQWIGSRRLLHAWLQLIAGAIRLVGSGFAGWTWTLRARSHRQWMIAKAIFFFKWQPTSCMTPLHWISGSCRFLYRCSLSHSHSVNKPLAARPWCLYVVLLHRDCTDPYLPIYHTCVQVGSIMDRLTQTRRHRQRKDRDLHSSSLQG